MEREKKEEEVGGREQGVRREGEVGGLVGRKRGEGTEMKRIEMEGRQ